MSKNVIINIIQVVYGFCKYLLLTKFKGRTVSYRPSFFPIDLWPKCEACGPEIDGEKQGSVTYSTDRENEVSKIFIIHVSLRLTGSGTISIHLEQLQISDAPRKQKESI